MVATITKINEQDSGFFTHTITIANMVKSPLGNIPVKDWYHIALEEPLELDQQLEDFNPDLWVIRLSEFTTEEGSVMTTKWLEGMK